MVTRFSRSNPADAHSGACAASHRGVGWPDSVTCCCGRGYAKRVERVERVDNEPFLITLTITILIIGKKSTTTTTLIIIDPLIRTVVVSIIVVTSYVIDTEHTIM